MKTRPDRFLSYDKIDHNSEIFHYIQELHAYLWRFIRAVTPDAQGILDDHIDQAIDELEAVYVNGNVTDIPDVKALVDAARGVVDAARGTHAYTDWTVDQFFADEPAVKTLDAALTAFEVPE